MKVAVVTPTLAHYRRQLFLRLDESQQFTFEHYSEKGSNANIEAMDADELRNFVRLENVRIGPFLWQRGLLKLVLERKMDAYIFTGDLKYLSTWIAASIARLTGKKIHFWTIGWHRREHGVLRIVRLGFYKIAHRLMVYSGRGKRFGAEHGYPEERIDVVYNSVSGISSQNPELMEIDSKQLAVGAVARLYPAKNLSLLLEAVSKLNRKDRDIKVILGGAGPDAEVLKRKAVELGVNCEFLGAIHEPREIDAFYRRVMITVIPSAAGLSTIQSLAHGVPVITDDNNDTQGPEVDAIEDGITGSRVVAGSVRDLADEISWWLNELTESPTLTAERCRREVIERWSPDAQAYNIIESLNRSCPG